MLSLLWPTYRESVVPAGGLMFLWLDPSEYVPPPSFAAGGLIFLWLDPSEYVPPPSFASGGLIFLWRC